MQELQAKVTQAQVEIIDRERFEQGINEVVAKYENYTVTADCDNSCLILIRSSEICFLSLRRSAKTCLSSLIVEAVTV